MRRQSSSVGSPLLRWGDETMPTNSRSRMASTDSPWRLARSSTVSRSRENARTEAVREEPMPTPRRAPLGQPLRRPPGWGVARPAPSPRHEGHPGRVTPSALQVGNVRQ